MTSESDEWAATQEAAEFLRQLQNKYWGCWIGAAEAAIVLVFNETRDDPRKEPQP